MNCIWNVAEQDRRCEYCSFTDGCDCRRWSRLEPIEGRARKFIRIMSDILGDDVLKKTKSRPFVWGRFIIAYELRQEGYLYEQIGRVLTLNHSTVVYGVIRVEELLRSTGVSLEEERILWQKFLKNSKKCGIKS